MSEHNLLAILVGSIAGFGFGALWYSPVAFLNPWMPEAGITPDVHLKNPGKVFWWLVRIHTRFGGRTRLSARSPTGVTQSGTRRCVDGALPGWRLHGRQLPVR